MNDSAYKISLDINEYGSQLVLKAKKMDTGRKIYISLRVGGTPYTIAADCYAVFTAEKQDGSILYNACTIENNEIIYEFTEQTCAAVGRNRCEIKLYGFEDKLITSPRFALLVDGTVYPEGRVVSSDEFSALTQLITESRSAADEANRAAGDADSAAEIATKSAVAANLAAENASKASEKTATDAKYFDIDFDGVVSLKAEYQADGSKNAELPEIIVIPDVINNTAVSALAESMFENNLRVKSITIPSHITVIPKKFANNAHNLAEINGTENVESIGQTAFQRCSIKKALFPTLKQFDGVAQLNGCPYLTVVDIGDTVSSIPTGCFNACESLSLILGGASVTILGEKSFFATRNLKNLPVVENVASIGNQAFALSRVNFDWWNHTFSSVGTDGTPAKFNPTDWWSGCTYEACENPLGSTFHQSNPEWASDTMAGTTNTYAKGCVEISTAHIYSALSGVKFDSPKYFVENIVGSIDNGSLLVPTSNNDYNFADMANWLTHLGLECEVLTDGYNSTNLQKVYDALKEGALILTGINPGHAAVLYGIASNGEVLTLDSSSYQYNVGVYEAKTFQQPIWSIAKAGMGIVVVKKGE